MSDPGIKPFIDQLEAAGNELKKASEKLNYLGELMKVAMAEAATAREAFDIAHQNLITANEMQDRILQ